MEYLTSQVTQNIKLTQNATESLLLIYEICECFSENQFVAFILVVLIWCIDSVCFGPPYGHVNVVTLKFIVNTYMHFQHFKRVLD